jgi:hypothetical protein
MYKKHARHDIEAESANNREQFATQSYNFMREHPDIVISQVSIPQINLDISTAPLPPVALSSASFTPYHQKYNKDKINEPTPCTPLYVKGRTLWTIEFADTIVMATRIMHGRPMPSECVVVNVTMIREGHEFEDLDYLDEEEVIEKLKDAKGNFILWPHKDIILITRSSLIVLLQSRGALLELLQPLKIPYATLPDLLHLKILHKLPLLPKIHHLHNIVKILLFKIHRLNKLLSNILLHMCIL